MSKNIQVFCTKSIRFVHPKDESVSHEIRNHEFTMAPSWIRDTMMFHALKRENSIKVIESAKDLAEVETTGKIAGAELEKEPEASTQGAGVGLPEETTETAEEAEEETAETAEAETAEEETKVDYESMSNKDLYNLCIEKGIEVEAKRNKAYYVEKLEKAI